MIGKEQKVNEREQRIEEIKKKAATLKYSNENVRIVRNNRIFLATVLISCIWLVLSTVFSIMAGNGSTAKMLKIVIALISQIIMVAYYVKNKESNKFRYIATSAFFIAFTVSVLVADNSYVLVSIVPVIMVVMLYSDCKLMNILCVSSEIVIIIRCVMDFVILKVADKSSNLTITMLIVLSIFCFLAHKATKLLKIYNDHTFEAIRAKNEIQSYMMEDILEIADVVQNGTNQIKKVIDDLDSNNQQVNNSVREISTGIQGVAENTQQQTVMTGNIQNAIQDIDDASKQMTSATSKTVEVVDNSKETVGVLKNHSAEIATRSQSVADSMTKLQEKAAEVQNITSLIFSISSQTNLLALNASIEAARAGEHGRGFSVVADEIRQLAEQTRGATEQISAILNDLNVNADEAAMNVSESVLATQKQDEYIDQVFTNFNNINQDIQKVDKNMIDINKKIFDLGKANTVIVDNISQLSAATEEMTAGSEEAAAMSEDNLQAFEDMKKLFNQVVESVNGFKKYTKDAK